MEVVASALQATGHLFEFAAAGLLAYVAYRRFTVVDREFEDVFEESEDRASEDNEQ